MVYKGAVETIRSQKAAVAPVLCRALFPLRALPPSKPRPPPDSNGSARSRKSPPVGRCARDHATDFQ